MNARDRFVKSKRRALYLSLLSDRSSVDERWGVRAAHLSDEPGE
jgi:hypothetical protein